MEVKTIGKTEILRRIWLFSAKKMKSTESVSKQPTQLIVELKSTLRQKLGTLVILQWADFLDQLIFTKDGF